MAATTVTSGPPGPPARPRNGGIAEFLRAETTGGVLLVAATAVALLWANLAGASYRSVWDTSIGGGPGWLHLALPLSTWVTDGLLAVFFFVAGTELKRELTVGELASARRAALPAAAAVGGMIGPVLVALAASRGAAGPEGGWAVPVATDIAFALGVLALAGRRVPQGLRVLLLSMAVVDDLGAIVLIAVLFSHGLSVGWLAAAAVLVACYAMAARRGGRFILLLAPLALAAWVAVHAGGVHATVVGVALGLLTPARPRAGATRSLGETLQHHLHPVSAGFVVPAFALSSAGLPLGALGDTLTDPLAQGVAAGLLIGKPLGILGGAWLALRSGLARLPRGMRWTALWPVAVLGGVGYTVSLLIGRLAFSDPAVVERVSASVLVSSIVMALVALAGLRSLGRSGVPSRGGTPPAAAVPAAPAAPAARSL